MSAAEAAEDGWRGSLEGLICPCCDTAGVAMPDIPPFQTKEELIEAMRLRRAMGKIVYKYEPGRREG